MSERSIRSFSLFLFLIILAAAFPRAAHAQGFISPSFGYNFGGDSGCISATNCEDKNWNFGISAGALGSIVGFEAELTYEGEFFGKTANETSKVTTFMANFMIAPRISIVQPYGLIGFGVIRTALEDSVTSLDEGDNQFGWNIGGGVILFVNRHVGLKGDIRYYHSFEALDLLGIDLAQENNKLDFGRFAFGAVFAF